MKKILSLLLAFSLALSLAACGGSASSAASSTAVSEAASSAAASEEEAASPLSATEPLRIAGLKGPTTMGLVNLLSMEQAGTAAMDYDLQLYGAAVSSSSEAAAEEATSDTAALEAAELALPPQAARLSARLNASSKDRNFFMKYSFSHPARPAAGTETGLF